jgi:hypothetical protein
MGIDHDGVYRKSVLLEDRREVTEETPGEGGGSIALVFYMNQEIGFLALEPRLHEDVRPIFRAVQKIGEQFLGKKFDGLTVDLRGEPGKKRSRNSKKNVVSSSLKSRSWSVF